MMNQLIKIGVLIFNLSLILAPVNNLEASCQADTIYQTQFDAGVQYPKSRSILIYNNQNRITQRINQNWDDQTKQYVNYQKFNNTYNGNGDNLEAMIYVWNQNTSSWDNWSKFVSTYDGNFNNTESIYSTWNNNNSSWSNSSKTVYTFDAQNNELSSTTLNWNASSSNWVNRFQTLSTYSSNKIATQTDYDWDKVNSLWEPYNKINYTYDGSGHLTLTLSQGWNLGTNQWDNEYRNTYSYNNDNLEILNKEEGWNSGWEISSQTTTSYNQNKDITEKNYQVWNPVDMKWENAYKTTYTFNSTFDLLRIDNYSSWSISANDYNFHTRDEYICDGILSTRSVSLDSHQIFPNPCTNNEINITINEVTKYIIFDMLGNEKQSGSLSAGTNKVSINLNKGLYVIRTSNSVQKLIVN